MNNILYFHELSRCLGTKVVCLVVIERGLHLQPSSRLRLPAQDQANRFIPDNTQGKTNAFPYHNLKFFFCSSKQVGIAVKH
jgi:hypothetical protein